MPKISVQLEADSAEEFQALLAAFNVSPVLQQAAPEPKRAVRTEKIAEKPVLTTLMQDVTPEASQGPSQAAEALVEPQKAKRGRPFKTAPVEPEAAPVAAVAEPEPVKVEEPVKATPPKPAKAKEPEIVVSRQDLLDAFSEYVQRYGASFGFSDISSLLQKNLGDGVRKASDVPEEKLQVAIGAIKTAIADNPFNRKRDYA